HAVLAQPTVALVVDLRVGEGGLVLVELGDGGREGRLRLVERLLIGPRVDLRAELAGLDLRVEVAGDRLDRPRHVGPDLHRDHRVHAPRGDDGAGHAASRHGLSHEGRGRRTSPPRRGSGGREERGADGDPHAGLHHGWPGRPPRSLDPSAAGAVYRSSRLARGPGGGDVPRRTDGLQRERTNLAPAPPRGSMERIPATAEEIDAAWLTRALSARHPGVRVAGVELVERHEATNAHARLRVDYHERAGAP